MEMQIPQLQDISYILAIQRFISYFIHHMTHHRPMPTKHTQKNNLFVNLRVIPYNFRQYVAQYWQGEQKMLLLTFTLQFRHFLFTAKPYPMSKLKQIMFCNASLTR